MFEVSCYGVNLTCPVACAYTYCYCRP